MQRRGFLGLFAGAVAAKPDPAKLLARVPFDGDMVDFNIMNIGSHVGDGGPLSSGVTAERKAKLVKRLAKLVGGEDILMAREKRRFYSNQIDPETASLRSLSLTAKVKRTRDIQWRTYVRNQRSEIEGILGGLWDEEYY